MAGLIGAKKLVLVVGAGRHGIGEACVKQWASHNYDVAFLGRTRENLTRIEAAVPGSKGYVCDVGDRNAVEETLTTIKRDFQGKGVHTLIYNATSSKFATFEECSVEDFEASMASGPTGLFRIVKILVPDMVEAGEGVIGVTGATASWRGVPNTTCLAPAKFAMRALCQSFARQYTPKGVHVFHAIIDGMVDLPMSRGWMPDKPTDEWIQAADVAESYYSTAHQPRSCWTTEYNIFAHGAGGGHLNI